MPSTSKHVVLILLMIMVCRGTVGLGTEKVSEGVRSGQSLSELLYHWAKSVSPGNKINLYGNEGLLQQTLRLNPEIRDSNLVYPGMRIRLPAYGREASRIYPEEELVQLKAKTNTKEESDGATAEKLSSEPTPLPEAESRSSPFPWMTRGELGVGAMRAQLSENISGARTVTGNLVSAPSIEGSLSLRKRGKQADEISPWEICTIAALQAHPKIVDTSFPLTYGLEAALSRKDIPSLPELGASIQWEQLVQGTPSLDQSSSSSTAPTILVRRTNLLWVLASFGVPGELGRLPFEASLGVGRSLVASSKAPSDAASLNGIAGWKFRAGLSLGVGQFFSVPLSLEGRWEKILLGGSSGTGEANEDSLEQSSFGGYFRLELF